MGIFRQLLSALVIPKDEFRVKKITGKNTGVIVQQPEEFVDEIKDALGNHYAWVRENGGWDTSMPLTLREHIDGHGRKFRRIENDVDLSFEVMKMMHEPVKLPDNLVYTAYGIFEKK